MEKYLANRGIDSEVATRYGIKKVERHGSADWICFPFVKNGVTVNNKYKNISKKSFEQDKGGEQCFWNYDVLLDETLKDMPIIITEGELDAIAAIQCGYVRTVSVPNGAPANPLGEQETSKYYFLQDAMKLISDCKEIIIAVDNDGAGSALLQDLSIRIGKERCKWVKYPKNKTDGYCKDLNETLACWGDEGVRQSITRARWVMTDGVYSMDELPPIPEPIAYSIGYDDGFAPYKIRKGDFCVVTGIPSHGKSSILNDIACRMVSKYGWRVAFASFEQKPQTEHRRNLRAWFNNGIKTDYKNADLWIKDHFRFIMPSGEDDVTLEWVLSRCAMSVTQHDCDMIIIDPWNEMDHRRNYNESLTEYVGNAIKSFKRMANKLNIHLIVAAHPAKMRKEDGSYKSPTLYDISDSAHWSNKADIGFSVHRPDKSKNETIVTVLKVRYQYACGTPETYSMSFDDDSKKYTYQGIL